MSSTTNYIAWRERRDLEDGARAKVQAAAAATEKPADTVPPQMVGKKVADLTGNKQAPDDLVADNRKLFNEVIDNAKLDEIRSSAPKLAEWLTQKQNYALAKGDLDNLLPIAKTIARIGEAPKVPPLWKAWPADNLSPPAAAALVPFGDDSANAVGPPRSAADKMASASGQPAQGAGQVPVPAAPTIQGNAGVGAAQASEVVPTAAVPDAVSKADGAEQGAVSQTPYAQEKLNVGAAGVPAETPGQTPPAVISETPGTQPSLGVGATVAPVLGPDDVAMAAPINEGNDRTSAPAISVADETFIDAIANAKPENYAQFHNAIDLRPGIPREEFHRLLDEMAQGIWTPDNAKKALRSWLQAEQSHPGGNKLNPPNGTEGQQAWEIDPGLPTSTDALITFRPPDLGKIGGQVLEAPRLVEDSHEGWKGFFSLPIVAAGEGVEWAGQLAQMPEEELTATDNFIHSIAYARPENYAALRKEIDKQSYIMPVYAYPILDSVIFEHKSPEQALDELNSLRLDRQQMADSWQAAGQWLQNYAKTDLAAAPGKENSVERVLGEVAAEVLLAFSVSKVAKLWGLIAYGAVRSGGALTAGAREAGAEEPVQSMAAWVGPIVGAVASIPFAERVTKIPIIKNSLGRYGTAFLQGLLEGGQQAAQTIGENVAKRSLYNKDQGVLDGSGLSFAIGATASHLGQLTTRVQMVARNQAALKQLSEQVSLAKAGGQDPEVLRDSLGTAAKGTPAEYLYIHPDQFFTAMKGVGVDPRGVFSRLTGMSEADFDMAVSSGGDLRIPISSYLADLAGTREGDALAAFLGFDPEGTLPEAVKHSEDARKTLQKLFEEGARGKYRDEGVSSDGRQAPHPSDKEQTVPANSGADSGDQTATDSVSADVTGSEASSRADSVTRDPRGRTSSNIVGSTKPVPEGVGKIKPGATANPEVSYRDLVPPSRGTPMGTTPRLGLAPPEITVPPVIPRSERNDGLLDNRQSRYGRPARSRKGTFRPGVDYNAPR